MVSLPRISRSLPLGAPKARPEGSIRATLAARCRRSEGQVLIVGWPQAAILVSAVAAAVLLSSEARAAGAAYAVDTAEVSEVGACKVESWMSAASNHDFFAATVPTCVLGLMRPVEASVQISRARRRGMEHRRNPEAQDQHRAERDRQLGHRAVRRRGLRHEHG
jgi:hypothetical protein